MALRQPPPRIINCRGRDERSPCERRTPSPPERFAAVRCGVGAFEAHRRTRTHQEEERLFHAPHTACAGTMCYWASSCFFAVPSVSLCLCGEPGAACTTKHRLLREATLVASRHVHIHTETQRHRGGRRNLTPAPAPVRRAGAVPRSDRAVCASPDLRRTAVPARGR